MRFAKRIAEEIMKFFFKKFAKSSLKVAKVYSIEVAEAIFITISASRTKFSKQFAKNMPKMEIPEEKTVRYFKDHAREVLKGIARKIIVGIQG